MNISLLFIRTFFTLLCFLFSITYSILSAPEGATLINLSMGLLLGSGFALFFIASEFLLKRFNLKAFNLAALGLFIGFLMGKGVLLIFQSAVELAQLHIQPDVLSFLQIGILLFCAYQGMIMTVKASDELSISIPFIRFTPSGQKKKDLLIDWSILTDSRIIDMASSGILDYQLILPRFALKELHTLVESSDESLKAKAKRCLEVFKRLETITTLNLRYCDTDFPEIKDPISKLTQLARLLDANIITADINRIQQSSIEGVRIINIHMLSNALKPLTQTGEQLTIKVQRYGKEPRQGVGYLEDGTMVVVNGGAEYIGETIKAHVLSVKHTSSGRMIFCNANEENSLLEDNLDLDTNLLDSELESKHKSFFTTTV